jgi:hypothetical protein
VKHADLPSTASLDASAPRSAPLLPTPAEIAELRGPYLVPLVLLLVTRVVGWLEIPFASEDAYITFRFARNLVAGNGLVFNPNERVFGFSSPVWTLWNAIGFRLTQHPADWAKATSILADVVTLLVLVPLLVRYTSRQAAWCFAFFFAVWPYFAFVCASGMEMNLMLALIVLGAALVDRRHPAAGPVLALLALTRPEGIATAALISLGARGRDRIVAGTLFAVGVAALWLYFGSPVPQSVAAKSLIYGTPGPWSGRYWWDWLSPILIGFGPALNDTAYLTILRIVMFPAAVVGVRELWSRRATGLGLAAGAMLLVWFGYAAIGVAYFYWYLMIPLAGIALAASVGFPRITRGRLIPITAALFCISLWSVADVLYRARAQAEYLSFGEIANYLLGNCRPGQSVMLEPIGIIGYETPLRVIDEVGLVSPDVATRRRAGSGWYADIAARERPDWLVVRLGVVRTGNAFAGAGAPFRDLAERDSTFARYEHVFTAQKESGDLAVLVFRRR